MIETRLYKLKVGTPRTINKLLRKAIAEQSRQVHLEGSSETGFRDMGATLVIAHIRRHRCHIANIGDSRGYRLRNAKLTQLTRDHSVVSELIEKGALHPAEAENHAAAGQITRYIGMPEKPKAHVRSFTLKKADRLLLCTDGLTDMLPDRQIKEILVANTDPQAACDELVKAANHAGGHDNITVLVIDWLKNGAPNAPSKHPSAVQ
jgi:protein phosphatase